ncbi:MAG: fatty acid desaturase [Myxococcales bacterium]|nr:fatty acid desaturase [Myxococcales bacterium]
MKPRNSADYRTILWVLLTPAVVAVQYARPELIPYLCWVSCYFALACGVIAHNHNHCGTFASRGMNQAFGAWISIFYGYPTFAWIPTHNNNHHKFTNAPGDATITWRHTNRHNFFVALTYPFVSSYYQSALINDFVGNAKEKGGKLYSQIRSQYLAWGGGHVLAFALAVWLHGAAEGLYVWGMSMGLPAFFALWTIMLFNYEQHVHADPFSESDHSRSFTSKLLNFLLFNNGYHAAHHERAGAHWTELPAIHAELAPKIAPVLNQRSVWWYWFRQYALAPLVPSLGTVQIGAGPMHPPVEGSGAPVEQGA